MTINKLILGLLFAISFIAAIPIFLFINNHAVPIRPEEIDVIGNVKTPMPYTELLYFTSSLLILLAVALIIAITIRVVSLGMQVLRKNHKRRHSGR